MNFTSETLLLAHLTQDQIDSVKGEDGVHLTEAIAQADARITAATGIIPAADNHRVLVAIANRLVIWTLTGRQQGIAEEEIDRRRKNYEDALFDLEAIADGSLDVGIEEDTTSAPAVGCRARRMTEY